MVVKDQEKGPKVWDIIYTLSAIPNVQQFELGASAQNGK